MQLHIRFRGRTVRTALGIAFGLLAAGTAEATIQVDCDTPDDFCTGDPCVTTDPIEIMVASCVLDFSPRALVLAHTVAAPNGGTLSLTAGSIEVKNRILGTHLQTTAGDGADVSLIATGDIVVDRAIDVSGRLTNGTILLDSGADITLDQRLRARGRGSGATAPGGTVTVQADGTVSSSGKGRIDVRGRKNHTAAGAAIVAGQNGVTLAGRIEARGTPGGSVSVSSTAGDVAFSEEIRVGGEDAAAGQVTITAAGQVSAAPPRASVAANSSGNAGPGGVVQVNAAGPINLYKVRARGVVGGVISLLSATGAITVSRLEASGFAGQIDVTSAADVSIESARLDGGSGRLHVVAAGDALLGDSLGDRFDARGGGGEIEAAATGNLTATGRFYAEGGCIGLSAGGVLDTSRANFDGPVTGSCP